MAEKTIRICSGVKAPAKIKKGKSQKVKKNAKEK